MYAIAIVVISIPPRRNIAPPFYYIWLNVVLLLVKIYMSTLSQYVFLIEKIIVMFLLLKKYRRDIYNS